MYIKLFEQYILEKKVNKILYHGSPYRFESFKPSTTFFADNEEFAIDYTRQKSLDAAMDNEANIYVVETTANFFDANDLNDLEKLSNVLPDTIKYSFSNFGFAGTVDKKEYLLNLRGYYTYQPLEGMDNYKVGDTFPDPHYPPDSFLVVKKDDDFLYTIYEKTLNYDLDMHKLMRYSEDEYTPLKNFVSEYAKRNGLRLYGDTDIAVIQSLWSNREYYGVDKPNDEDHEEFIRLYDELKQNLINKKIQSGYVSKWRLKQEVLELEDTWRYYENGTTEDAIKKLGYDGFITKEKNQTTYAIFEPHKTTKILSYEFPQGHSFKDVKEYKKFLDYSDSVRELTKKMGKDSIWLMQWEIYKGFKDNLSIEETFKKAYDK